MLSLPTQHWSTLQSHIDVKHVALLGSVATVPIGVSAFRYYNLLRHVWRKQHDLEQQKLKLMQKLLGLKTPMENMERHTNLSIKAVRRALSNGRVSAVDLLEAFQLHALHRDAELHFISEVVYDADVLALMLTESDSVDEFPLLGMSVCFAEPIHMEHMSSSAGIITPKLRLDAAISHRDATLVHVLKEAKALPIFRTNVNVACLPSSSGRCKNYIYGETKNPLKQPSTGKELCVLDGVAVAVATRSCHLGWALDIANTSHGPGMGILLPAAFCGVSSLRPTPYRLSMEGISFPDDFQNPFFPGIVGPIAQDVILLVDSMKVLLSSPANAGGEGDMRLLDPTLAPVMFQDELYKRRKSEEKLHVGYFVGLEGSPACVPAVEHAVQKAVRILEQRGHKVVPLTLPRVSPALWSSLMRLSEPDAGRHKVCLTGTQAGWHQLLLWAMPVTVKCALSYLVYPFGAAYSNFLYGNCGLSSLSHIYSEFKAWKEWRSQVLTLVAEQQVDVLLGPVFPLVTPSVDVMNEAHFGALAWCSRYFAALHCPAGSVPVHRVTQEDVNLLAEQRLKFAADLPKAVLNDQEHTVGLPVSVQVAAVPWRDELCLAAMIELQKGLK